MVTAYLAGKMGGRRGYEVLEERSRAVAACKAVGITPIDPAANENIRDDDSVIDMRMDYVTMKNFVAKDRFAVEHCHVLLVLTGDTPSDGTSWEMGWATDAGIPVVMVAPKRFSGEIMSFSNILVSAIFPTVEQACDFIRQNYFPREEQRAS